ncbi:hypothetical protein Leryth_015569 [Lithospermum erythrorhizon]|nr:hypothetical protein Leryth_015569 [Lithospermum erythrorhizon]
MIHFNDKEYYGLASCNSLHFVPGGSFQEIEEERWEQFCVDDERHGHLKRTRFWLTTSKIMELLLGALSQNLQVF